MFKVPNQFRITKGYFSSDDSCGNNGAFQIPRGNNGKYFFVIASDGEGWEHVSVSLPNRTPTWEEMCLIKNIFWDSDDCVVQYHPPKSEYVNNCNNCLHLWRPVNKNLETPNSILVGLK
ncbi:MAG TPA: hypothetical protein PKZ42_01675 [Syntrophales bacterium]|nr:hypothetical protein [Syntrophales bacterium]